MNMNSSTLEMGNFSLAPNAAHAQEQARSVKVNRNDPCPCASGKKYKKCCGAAA